MPPPIPAYPDLSGKVALITGIGQTPVPGLSDDIWGNGAAIAYLLAYNGVKVFGCDLDIESAKWTAERLKKGVEGCDVHVCRGDVTDLDDINRAVGECRERFGRVDILVNNVGMTRAGDAVSLQEDIWDKQIEVNLKSVFLMCKAVLPVMEEQGGGVVVNNASLTALRYIGKPQIAYASAKAGVLGFTKHMACMWADKGVRVNCVVPGLIATPLVEGLRVSEDLGDQEAYRSITGAKIPLGRLGDAFDVANAVMFLGSDASKYVTGHELVVDGGVACSAE